MRIERNGHKGRVRLDVLNLPFGVIVANIGLSDVLIAEGETERQIFLEAAPWVSPSTRLVHATSREEGGQASLPIRLRVAERSPTADD